MAADTQSKASGPQGEFNLDEVIRLKGHHFKIVLIDGYTGKIAMKWITSEEAAILDSGGSTIRENALTGIATTRKE